MCIRSSDYEVLCAAYERHYHFGFSGRGIQQNELDLDEVPRIAGRDTGRFSSVGAKIVENGDILKWLKILSFQQIMT